MIKVTDLVKKFGRFTAVDSISFEVAPGDILGFLGPNGAGKSTTMRIITCFIPPTSGTVTVNGHDIARDAIAVRRQIGYLPESAPSYGEMTVDEFLRFVGDVRGMTSAERDRRKDEVMDLTALHGVREQLIETLSKGFRQRVCLAQALIHDPPVLILDEPTDGLDPNQKHDMRNLIRQMSAKKTIVLSTHILEEMEAVCTRAIIISEGRIVVDTTPEQLAAMSSHHNAVTLKTQVQHAAGLRADLRALPGVEQVTEETRAGGTVFELFPQKNALILSEVTRFLETRRIPVDELFVQRGHVDEVFRDVTRAVTD